MKNMEKKNSLEIIGLSSVILSVLLIGLSVILIICLGPPKPNNGFYLTESIIKNYPVHGSKLIIFYCGTVLSTLFGGAYMLSSSYQTQKDNLTST